MNTKELYKALEDAGWSIGSQIDKSTGVSWYAYKRLVGAKDCSYNGKAPCLVITPQSVEFFQSVEFSVRGQMSNGMWADFKVYYGIQFEDALPKEEEIASVLRTAWDAVA
jgi:hypothetical protein